MSNRQGLTSAQVLAALYNASRPQGMGFLQAKPGDMTVAEAEAILPVHKEVADGLSLPVSRAYFDYLRGRVIKVDVSEDPLDFRLYDRDLGPGAGEAALFSMLDKVTRP